MRYPGWDLDSMNPLTDMYVCMCVHASLLPTIHQSEERTRNRRERGTESEWEREHYWTSGEMKMNKSPVFLSSTAEEINCEFSIRKVSFDEREFFFLHPYQDFQHCLSVLTRELRVVEKEIMVESFPLPYILNVHSSLVMYTHWYHMGQILYKEILHYSLRTLQSFNLFFSPFHLDAWKSLGY